VAGASPAVGHGGTPNTGCNLVGDCSGSLWDQWVLGDQAANDLLWADFTMTTPGGTNGWTLDFAYFSTEFPEYVGSEFNDIFTVWVETPEFVGNQCFINGQPCTVTALDAAADTFGGNNNTDFPYRGGTGFGTESCTWIFCSDPAEENGQATGWFEMSGPATPSSELRIAFIVFDMGDTIYDTTVLVDDFRWDCAGCIPGLPVEDGGCGIEPQ
jgi:hypothetical protein